MESNQQSITLTHVWSAEPNAVKLRVNRSLLQPGDLRRYEKPEQAADAPLAKRLLDVDGVISVEMDSASVTVFMAEESDWDEIVKNIPGVISDHLESGLPILAGEDSELPAKKFTFGFKQVEQRSRDDQMRIIQELLDTEVNPAVASHGGFFRLIDIKDNNVYVELGGGCQGCGMADVTLKQGVELRMREAMPEMKELIDTTDHASGNNPYYRPGK